MKRFKPKTLMRIVSSTLKLSILAFILIFIVAPLIFKHSYLLQRSTVFANFVRFPRNPDYSNPGKYGIDGCSNSYVVTNENIKLGVWHILPDNYLNQSISYNEQFFSEALNDGQNIIIYNHGNSGNRVASHRIELYQVLRKFFHVIAFDYRSYGDSSDVAPTEIGVVRDCQYMFDWVRNKTTSKIFLWGHSLGTGITTHALALYNFENIRPVGLILESPFSNIKDEISEHPFSFLFRSLPWFYYTIVQPIYDNGIRFQNDINILKVNCPIVILHAEDDAVVPFKLGYKLYETALRNRLQSQGDVRFHKFEGKFRYGHKFICRAPQLPKIIEIFVEHAIKESKEKHLI